MSKHNLPRYLTFANQLRQQIADGRFAAGAQLPSQRNLADQFKTTVMTMRSALDLLSEEGLIRIEHGIGMFVVDNQLRVDDYQIVGTASTEALRSFSDTSTNSGQAETEIVMINVAAIHEDAAKALNLAADSSVCRLERLRRVDSVPTVLQHSYVAPVHAALLGSITAEQSLYGVLQDETKRIITSAREYLLPVQLDERKSKLLGSVAGDSAWLSVRVSSDESGAPLVYDEAWLTADSLLVTVDYFGRKNESTLHWRTSNNLSPLQYLLD